MSVQHFEVVSFEPWKDGVVRIRIACDEPEGRVCHTFYARQEDYDDRVNELDTHAAEVARLTARLRVTCQALVAAAGADGPMSAEDAADRLVKKYDEAREEVARLRGALGFHLTEQLCIGAVAQALEDWPASESVRVGQAIHHALRNYIDAALAPAARKDQTT